MSMSADGHTVGWTCLAAIKNDRETGSGGRSLSQNGAGA